MDDFLLSASLLISRLDWRSVLDIFIVAFALYWLLVLLRRTTAMSLLRGIVILFLFAIVVSNVFQLNMLSWILRNSLPALLVAIPILFQPELRRALERLGRTGWRRWMETSDVDHTIGVVVNACQRMSERHFGALLVLERETGLQDYIDTGVEVDAIASGELLEGIFFPNSPLHDGAVILRGGRVVAAGCMLPLSDSPALSSALGARHRAAIGITERTDALSVVVSEETGTISLATNGRLIADLDQGRLRRILRNLYGVSRPATAGRLREG